MKKLAPKVQVVEIDGEGFTALMGQIVTIFCLNYIYTGELIGVNDTCILLDNPSIVYETGNFSDSKWKDAQKLPNQLYVQMSCIESFGIVK